MEERTIILHACPPLEVDKPSPSLTVLKSFLIQQNINAKIIYWNLIFENLKLDFLFDNPDTNHSSDQEFYNKYKVFAELSILR